MKKEQKKMLRSITKQKMLEVFNELKKERTPQNAVKTIVKGVRNGMPLYTKYWKPKKIIDFVTDYIKENFDVTDEYLKAIPFIILGYDEYVSLYGGVDDELAKVLELDMENGIAKLQVDVIKPIKLNAFELETKINDILNNIRQEKTTQVGALHKIVDKISGVLNLVDIDKKEIAKSLEFTTNYILNNFEGLTEISKKYIPLILVGGELYKELFGDTPDGVEIDENGNVKVLDKDAKIFINDKEASKTWD